MEEQLIASPLSIPSFKLFIATRFSFTLAMQMVIFTIAWHIYDLTGNKLSIGLLGLSEVVPAIGLALYAGYIIDKSNKRNMLRRNILFYLMAIICLTLVCTTKATGLLGVRGVELSIYFIYFCTGIFRAFTGPTMSSIVAQLVPRPLLPRAISISTTAWQCSAVSGPVIAGWLIAHTGISNTFIIAIILLSLASVFVNFIPSLPVANTNKQLPAWESVKEGLRYVFKTKELVGAMSVDMFAVFFGGATSLLPVFAVDILHISAADTGLLKAAQGVGSILMLYLVSRYPLKKNQGKIMLQCVLLYGVAIIVFALSKSFWLSFAALFFGGAFDAVSMVVRSTILQLYVPDDMRGRVSSVGSMFVNSSNELGEFESGVAARLMNTVPSVIFGGCMTIIIVCIAWVKAPKLRKLEY